MRHPPDDPGIDRTDALEPVHPARAAFIFIVLIAGALASGLIAMMTMLLSP